MKLRSGDNDARANSYRWRSILVLCLVLAGAGALVARAVELQLLDHGFLAKQGHPFHARGQNHGASRRDHGSQR